MPSILIGVGASTGTTQGKAITFKNLDAKKINESTRDGMILVIPYSSPLITFALLKAKAIVTDMGGTTCHAAIIAREIGIPCVVNTKTATRRIASGMMVFVDGQKGIVRFEK